MSMENISQDLIKELFDYHEDGYLVWKKSICYKNLIGGKAGYLHKNNKTKENRQVIGFNKKQYKASRLIFLYHHGWLPPVVDHKNNITTDDRIDNLRPASVLQNARNRSSMKHVTSKYLGVHFAISKHEKIIKKTGEKKLFEYPVWIAQVTHNGKKKFIGSFKTETEAALAYNLAAKESYGEFANINILNS